MRARYVASVDYVWSKEFECSLEEFIEMIIKEKESNSPNYQNVKVSFDEDDGNGVVTFNKSGYARGAYYYFHGLNRKYIPKLKEKVED